MKLKFQASTASQSKVERCNACNQVKTPRRGTYVSNQTVQNQPVCIAIGGRHQEIQVVRLKTTTATTFH